MKGVLLKLEKFISALGARPFALGMLLSVIFWIFLGNFVVAACAGLLVSFFIAAAVSGGKLNRRPRDEKSAA